MMMPLALPKPDTKDMFSLEPTSWPTVVTSRLAAVRLFGTSPVLSTQESECPQGYQALSEGRDYQENRIVEPIVSWPEKGREVSPPA